MEFFLYCWDELDDVAALCRHVSQTVIAEVAAPLALVRVWGETLGGWLRLAVQIETR